MDKQKQKMILAALICVLLVLIVFGSVLREESEKRFEKEGFLMGTNIKLVVYHNAPAEATKALDAAYERIWEIEQIASRWTSSSELSQLNEFGEINDPSLSRTNRVR